MSHLSENPIQLSRGYRGKRFRSLARTMSQVLPASEFSWLFSVFDARSLSLQGRPVLIALNIPYFLLEHLTYEDSSSSHIRANLSWLRSIAFSSYFSFARNFTVLDPKISRFIAKYRVLDRTSPNFQNRNSMRERKTQMSLTILTVFAGS